MKLILLMIIVCMNLAHARHYRGGTFYWERINNRKIRISWRLSFQRSDTTHVCTEIGANTKAESLNMLKCKSCSAYNQEIYHQLPLTCIAYSDQNDWNLFEGSMEYEVEMNKFLMSYETKDKCTDSSWIYLQNFASGRCWNLLSQVDLTIDNNSPRVMARLPVYRARQGCEIFIDLQPTDPDGDDVRCRWADQSKQECPDDSGNVRVCGNPSTDSATAEIFEDKCLIRFNAEEGSREGYYGVSVMIEDFNEGSTIPKSKVPYQFLIQVTERGSCIEPEVTLESNCDIIKPDEKWTNDITAKIPPGSDSKRVEQILYDLHDDITYNEEVPPPGKVVQSTLSLQTSKLGFYEYSVTAIDDYGLQGKAVSGKVVVTDKEEVVRPPPSPMILHQESFPASNSDLDEDAEYWFIKFNEPVTRPSKQSYITVTKDTPIGAEVVRYDSSNPDEVEFPEDDQTIARYKAPKNLESGEVYVIQVDKGFAVIEYSTVCVKNAIQNSINTAYPIKSPTPPEPFVDCGQSSITAYIPKWTLSDQSIEELHLIDPRCKSKENETHIIIQFAYDSCGTYIKKKSPDVTRFINILRDDPIPYKTSELITRKKRQVEIKIICDVEGVGIANVFFDPDTAVSSSKLKSKMKLEANLEMYDDKSYSTLLPYDTERSVAFSDRLFFAARAQDTNREVAIESCRATAKYKTCSKYDKKFEFISNGCPVDDTVKFHSSGSSDTKRFSIKTFAMVDHGINDAIWVTCSFVTCDPSDNNSVCRDLNPQNCGPASVGGRRRKRSSSDVETMAFIEVQMDME